MLFHSFIHLKMEVENIYWKVIRCLILFIFSNRQNLLVFHIIHKNLSTPIQLHTLKIWNSKKYTQFKMNSFIFFCLITSSICSKITNSLVWSLTHCLVTSHMKIGWTNFLIDEFFSMVMKNLKK
jgi:hypothetical protein